MYRPRNGTPTLRKLLLAATCCALGLSLLALPAAGAAGGRYVALGDSSSTGSGLGSEAAGSPPICYRTDNSYPAFIKAAYGFTDYAAVNCASAGITEFTNSQPLYDPYPVVTGYAPPQFDALNGTETLVTISIGANDSGYGQYINDCLQNSNPSATPCTDTYVSGGTNALVTSARDGLTNRLGPAIDKIHMKSPNAEVWVIGYPRLTPTDVSSCPGRIGISAGDAQTFDAWQVAVNNYARAETEAHDAYYVDLYTPSAGHDGCQADPADRWSNPNAAAVPPNAGWGLHPNLAGETAMAQHFATAYNSPRPIRPIKNSPTPIGQTLGMGFPKKKVAAVNTRLSPISRTAPAKRGARFTVSLARSGTVTFEIDRASKGHLRNGVCRALSKRASRGRKTCTRFARAGASIDLALGGGETPLYFTGRVSGKRLAEGRYRLRARLGTLSAKSSVFALSH